MKVLFAGTVTERVFRAPVIGVILWCMVFSCHVSATEEVLTFSHYTYENGLPSSYVKSISQDQYGFIWLATRSSVCRFDGLRFKEFPAYDRSGNPLKLISNGIFLFSDSVLIARTNTGGTYFYFDVDHECFYPYERLNHLGTVQTVVPVKKGFWIDRHNRLYFLDAQTGKLTGIRSKIPFGHIPGNVLFSDVTANSDQLVAVTNQHSILWIDFRHARLTYFAMPAEMRNLVPSKIYLDRSHNFWIDEETTGLFRLNLETGKTVHYSKTATGDRHLSHNMVHCFAEDLKGRMWVGTEAGLSLWSPVTGTFSFSRYDMTNPSGLNADPIYDAFCDRDGNVWLGTYFGGVNFWSAEKRFFKFWQAGGSNRQLGGNVVSCLKEDSKGNIWIGLEDLGVNKLDKTTGIISRYSSNAGSNGLSYNNVHDLFFLTDNSLWIATYTGGINILNVSTGKYSYVTSATQPELLSDNIYSFLGAGDSVFIATSGGLSVYDEKTRKFSRFMYNQVGGVQFESMCKSKNKIWFSSRQHVYDYDTKKKVFSRFDRIPEFNDINFVKADSKGRIWMGDCYDGLACYDEKSDRVSIYSKKNGFPATWIFSIQEVKNGWFWVSTDKGLVRINPEKKLLTLYDSNSGIPFNLFNFRASFKDSRGNVYFGGNNGMLSFNEADNPDRLKKLRVNFTGLQLFNKPVKPGDKSPLKKSINRIDKLVLEYHQNVFTIEFSALCYTLGGNCQYAYYLENFENAWNYVGNRNFATYTNLSPGTYYFHVKASEGNIFNPANERILEIVIRPPFWRSIWAFMLYVMLVVAIVATIYWVGKRLEKSKSMVEIERREKEHADEIHQAKLEFYTNISHELKTPLTLIIGPLNRILEEEKQSPAVRRSLQGIQKNARRLYQLINELLEFRKIEKGKECLQVATYDLKTFTDEIRESFEDSARHNKIDFTVSVSQPDIPVWFDINKLDKIVFNLLSNAFKYTNEGGRVELKLETVVREKHRQSLKYNLKITVVDTGIGIKPEYLDKIFDCFFKIDEEEASNVGSGIGLAYLKSLVSLHRGEITVESIYGQGSTFTVTLPVTKSDYTAEELAGESHSFIPLHAALAFDTEPEEAPEIKDADGLSHEAKILVVEDNMELLEFIKESLDEKYQVFTARNGVMALEKIKLQMPDIIISDVMMPEMDGLELTRNVKSDRTMSHIPVILLTAKHGIENKMSGLDTGADSYLEKPFYPDMLKKNIENILHTREMLINRFKDDIFVDVSEVTHTESDKVFMEEMTALIKNNISDPSLDVTFVVKHMGMSRSLLHLKLKSLVGYSTTEFIRSVRLREAVKLISSGRCNISEAAYETGFSSPTYFTRRFKEHYGKSPREYFNL
ncbi:MAG: two-component regulator propeller domain-containing protein [Bacteroidota bacterium]|nr:two-component regulator propeller domain-containing protein [Bacteroidota bacterium]